MKINTLIAVLFAGISCFSQNTNLENLITQAQWNALFPKRAGTFGVHPQGYTTDFYSFNNLKQAADEMADYLVEIKVKDGVWGQLITITRKSTNQTYIYSDVESWWHNNPTPETVVNVDFEHFVNRASDVNNKRELGAFLANISKETTGGWQLPVGGGTDGDYATWGLYFVHEVGYTSANSAGAYSQAHPDYPPNPAVGYYGRGPIQLSWNYNYGQFSKFLYNDINVLLDNPDAIQNDGVLAFKSTIWFWMMPQCPKPSCHQVMHDLWVPEAGEYTADKMYKKGFAHTNNIINGGLECRTTSTAAFTEKVVLRSELYKFYLGVMGLSQAQIELEYTGDYTTLCYESTTVAMQDYLNCKVIEPVVVDPSSISEYDNVQIMVYPNPTNSMLFVTLNESIEQIQVLNATGQIIRSIQASGNQAEVNVSELSGGLYFIRVQSNNKSITRPFSVK